MAGLVVLEPIVPGNPLHVADLAIIDLCLRHARRGRRKMEADRKLTKTRQESRAAHFRKHWGFYLRSFLAFPEEIQLLISK